MTSGLVDGGWVAPGDPGPSRRAVVVLCATAVLALGGWAGWLVWSASPVGGEQRAVALDLAREAPRGEVRLAGRARFAVVRRTLPPGRRYRVSVTGPPGVDGGTVAVRVASDGARIRRRTSVSGFPIVDVDPARGERIRLLVVVPAGGLTTEEAVGPLRSATAPLDRDRASAGESRRRIIELRRWLPVIVLAGLLGSVGLPLWAWRRSRARMFNLRLPGPGREPGEEPPSSLDAVGVAVLIAGAREVDEGDAFAGHVLDLVERRQVRMRRIDPASDERGVVLGLARTDEGVVADDPAVTVLRAIADDPADPTTVTLLEAPEAPRPAPVQARMAWGSHVDARARFERMVDGGATRPVRLATEVLGTIGAIAAIEGLRSDSIGREAVAWLVAALALPATAACTAWARDARRWRVVTRSRRVERAQWTAWRAALGGHDGPALDQRSLPLLVAAGGRPELLRATADPRAVALDAVTAATVDSLRAVVAGTPASR